MSKPYVCDGTTVHVISKNQEGKVIGVGENFVVVKLPHSHSVVPKSGIKVVSYKEAD